jgi:hypothetical protein
MGDMGDYWRDVREAAQQHRAEQHEKNRLATKDIDWREHTPWHWSADINGERLDFWPSKNKWMFRGKVSTGDVLEFIRARLNDV